MYRAFSTAAATLSREQINRIRVMLRVDLAGEIAANRIYEGQRCVLGHDKETAELLLVPRLICFYIILAYAGTRKGALKDAGAII